MAAARGTEFIGKALLEQVANNYDRRIAAIQEEVAALRRPTLAQRHREWRQAAAQAIMDLAYCIENGPAPTDAELSRFKIDSPPYPGEFDYKIGALESQVKALTEAKAKALAYVSALAAGPDGVVTLYAADLRRIGYGL